jgi:hypothetical protein
MFSTAYVQYKTGQDQGTSNPKLSLITCALKEAFYERPTHTTTAKPPSTPSLFRNNQKGDGRSKQATPEPK